MADTTPGSGDLARLVGLCRRHGPPVLARWPDPHAELLTLVWSPRFDRRHALALLTQAEPAPVQSRFALWQAATLFDHLSAPEQHRLRRLILRHQALASGRAPWGTMAHGFHSAH